LTPDTGVKPKRVPGIEYQQSSSKYLIFIMTDAEDVSGDTSLRSERQGRFEQQRQQKLARIRQLGVDPYGGRYDGAEAAEDVKSRFKDGDETQQAKCAGRIVLLRDIGKLIFMTIRDCSGTIQVGLSKNKLGRHWALAKLLEPGDIIGAAGQLGRTKTGEITIWVESLSLLSKSLLPPPEKFHGLADIDLRYRQRYVDLWANPEVLEQFKKRSGIIATIREFLKARGFLEVETPMMQQIAGGAAARPFVTHHNSLDMNLFLRISPELFLKRLLVGGMEKVFEINRNFRNEGLSRQHNPEFTLLEVYEAFGDYITMLELTEELIRHLAVKFSDEGTVQWQGHKINYLEPFRRVTYGELFEQVNGFAMYDKKKVRAKAAEAGIDQAKLDDWLVINEVFEATVEKSLIQPTFVLDYPSAISPLTRPKGDDARLCERWDLFIGAMEIGPAYTELNDPQIQEAKFHEQLKGAGEGEQAFRSMDEDFIKALKYGMPPAGGLGIGIDRLVMVLTGATSIRDVVLFPLLKPIL